MRRSGLIPLVLTCATVIVACGGADPVSFSQPVGIELKGDADKVVAGSLTDEKGINTESGNPYGAFVSAGRDAIGKDPSRIEVTSVTLLLGAGSTGVTALNEIFAGNVEVLFEMSDTGDSFLVAHRTIDASTQGGGPLPLTIDFDESMFTGVNFTKLLGGNFSVVYRGPTNAAYAASGAKANLQLTFTFEAFE